MDLNEKKIKKKLTKNIIIFSILIIILSFGLVTKTFQNDTYFNISIGKYILENGIDMKEHFSWIDGLTYTYSHWAFDIIAFLIFNSFGFTGIYLSTIVFTIIIMLTLFNLINSNTKSPLIAFLSTLITGLIIAPAFSARSQIISFLCFIIEIYCIEKFIETDKIKYGIFIGILSIIVANFHAASWIFVLILFAPYLVASLFNSFLKNKLNNNKVTLKNSYNSKKLLILFILICLTGLITPIKDVPYTYTLKSMFGNSNLSNGLSAIDYINEMQPLVPIKDFTFIVFTLLFLGSLIIFPIKIKLEHLFLVLGLYIMALSSGRHVYLLGLLGCYVLSDLFFQLFNMLSKNKLTEFELRWTDNFSLIILTTMIISFSSHMLLVHLNKPYVDKSEQPIAATDYILENLDYENMRIYNQYVNGSYLMLNNIKVFIDSRLDVYCSEFNDTDILKDYLAAELGNLHYKNVFEKYDFTHLLIKNNSILGIYMCEDSTYKRIYSDEHYTIYEVIN